MHASPSIVREREDQGILCSLSFVPKNVKAEALTYSIASFQEMGCMICEFSTVVIYPMTVYDICSSILSPCSCLVLPDLAKQESMLALERTESSTDSPDRISTLSFRHSRRLSCPRRYIWYHYGLRFREARREGGSDRDYGQ